jgi:hypothetical protein
MLDATPFGQASARLVKFFKPHIQVRARWEVGEGLTLNQSVGKQQTRQVEAALGEGGKREVEGEGVSHPCMWTVSNRHAVPAISFIQALCVCGGVEPSTAADQMGGGGQDLTCARDVAVHIRVRVERGLKEQQRQQEETT